jgi:hypothetical protein
MLRSHGFLNFENFKIVEFKNKISNFGFKTSQIKFYVYFKGSLLLKHILI